MLSGWPFDASIHQETDQPPKLGNRRERVRVDGARSSATSVVAGIRRGRHQHAHERREVARRAAARAAAVGGLRLHRVVRFFEGGRQLGFGNLAVAVGIELLEQVIDFRAEIGRAGAARSSK